MPIQNVTVDQNLLIAYRLVANYNVMQANNALVVQAILDKLAAQPDGGAAVLAAMGPDIAADFVDRMSSFTDALNTVEKTTIDTKGISTKVATVEAVRTIG